LRCYRSRGLSLHGGEVLDQPVGNDLCHVREVCTFCKLMVRARYQLEVFLDA